MWDGLCLRPLGDKCLPLSDLPPPSLLADGVVPHSATSVVSHVFLRTVGAPQGVVTDRKTFESVVVVDVIGFLTELTLFVVVVLVVVSSAEFASDLTVGVDLVSEFPASGALDEVYLFGPLRDAAWGVEDDKGAGCECLDFGLVGVGDGEGDVRLLGVRVWLAISAGPVWSFDKGGVGEEGVGCS